MRDAGRPSAMAPCGSLPGNDRAVHLAVFLLCLIPVLLSGMLSTDGVFSTVHLGRLSVTVSLPCLFRMATGGRYRCPVCGMTRSFIYMSRLNIPRAYAMNPAGVPLYFLCLSEIPFRLTLLVTGRCAARPVRIAEWALAGFTGAAVMFFFIAQFF